MNPYINASSMPTLSPPALSVNVNKIALLRNSRNLGVPSVVQAARAALQAGAQGITVHPRVDQRHIKEHDVFDLSELIMHWPQAEFNIEGNPFHSLMGLLQRLIDRGQPPAQCTFVPDTTHQVTSDHGWDLLSNGPALRPLIAQVKALDIRVSLFMDPDLPAAMEMAADLGADRVELYTYAYAQAYGTPNQQGVVAQYQAAAEAAQQFGLGVNAGHDLNVANLADFVQALPQVCEVSIGHALISQALFDGLETTVKAYLLALRGLSSLSKSF